MFDPGARILIVDDAACVRTTMSHVLAEVGYRVRSAEDGFSALREIRQEVPDIVISDLNMPGMSGFELLQVIRHRFPEILLIAMSGSFSGSEVPSGVAGDAFYQKGSSIGALLQMIMAPHQMKRPTPQPCRAAAPLRIHFDGKESAGIEQVTIICPECMRTFSRIPGRSTQPRMRYGLRPLWQSDSIRDCDDPRPDINARIPTSGPLGCHGAQRIHTWHLGS